MKKLIFLSLLMFITSFKPEEKSKITFEYNKELQEIKDNLNQANSNLKRLDSINYKK